MLTAEHVINAYARNLHFVKTLTAGYSQRDSLVQPPVAGNCVNWIVGHIATYRNRILDILGEAPTLEPQIAARYGNGSQPVLGEEAGIGQMADLLAAIEVAQARLVAVLPQLTPDQGARVITLGAFTLSVAEWMLFLLRHEAYHTGQLELLQEVVKAGK